MNMEREEILAIYEAGPDAVINLIEQLLATIAKLEERVKSLEEQLNKNSRNSSKPPSTDAYAPKKPTPKSRRVKSGKKVGGQKGHPGTTLRMVDNPDEIRIIKVDQCSNCHTSLEDEEVKDYKRRQTFDIPPVQLHSTEHRGEIKLCPKCGRINTADFPDNVTQPAQYGSRLRSLAVYLHDYQFIPYDRSCELLSDIFGCDISPATLIRAETECFEGLEEFDNALKEALKQSPVLCCDETGMRINGIRNWLHVVCTATMTYYFTHQKRGSEAMDDMDILPNYDGVIVHDFWMSYFKYLCDHGLCDVHLLRELISISENYEQVWSGEMAALLIIIKECVDETKETSDSLTAEQINDFEMMYDDIIKKGLEENPPPLDLDTKPKKRGRKKQTKPKNLLDRFVKYKGDILRFMYDFDVPFDNNQAERDIRMTKVQQKISGTFRSIQGARNFCRIRGYIATMKKNKISVMDAIEAVFNGKPFVPFLPVA
ncbi:MAG TPA: IS66 family transposase [Methanosarcinaceae archaeon]|nr:IS66 family transposase [Methanosarcinaceae archaeon]